MYHPNDPDDRIEYFDHEKFMRKIRRTSLIGQTIMLVITLLAAISLFAAGTGGEGAEIKSTVKNIPDEKGIGDFSAELKEGKVMISWIAGTMEEQGMFLIQKSRDGASFSTIGFMKGETSDKPVKFSYKDDKPAKGISYYRIKTIGQDDRVGYSMLQRINCPFEKDNGILDLITGGTIEASGIPLKK